MIRKSISSALIATAIAVEKNQSKEKIAKWVYDTRVKIAKAIEPN